MARSERIYLVTQFDGHTESSTVAAFTVRHELEKWLSKQSEQEYDFELWVIPDGGHGGALTYRLPEGK